MLKRGKVKKVISYEPFNRTDLGGSKQIQLRVSIGLKWSRVSQEQYLFVS